MKHAGPVDDARVRPATVADHGRIVSTFAEAFFDDPVQSWVFPDPRRRRRYGRHFFTMHARRLLPRGLAWTADGAASLWAPAGAWQETPIEAARVAVRAAPGVMPHPLRVVRGLLSIEAQHPREPHVYLAVIGVRPDRQGQGLGTALLTPGLAAADGLGLPVYLESSNEKNLPLYRRFGFEVVSEQRLPAGGPSIWPMWRAAR